MTEEIDVSRGLALPEFVPTNVAPDEARILARRQEVMKLIKSGVRKQTELAKAVGVHPFTIRRDLDAIEEEYSELARGIQGIRDMEKMLAWERYQEVMSEMSEVRSEMMWVVRSENSDLGAKIKAAEVHAKASEKFMLGQDKINKLLGLNAPTKHSLTDPTGEQERTGINDELRANILRERKELERLRTENTVDGEVIEEAEIVEEDGDAVGGISKVGGSNGESSHAGDVGERAETDHSEGEADAVWFREDD